MELTLRLDKMNNVHDSPVVYYFENQSEKVRVNDWVGKKIKLKFAGEIFCTHCQKKIKKTYNQGYCFPCTIKLAECDICIVKPELCHYSKGTCREPAWGEEHCLKPHYVYLANSSGLKIGITREKNIPHRWIDQGASEAMTLFKVHDRLTSGLIESKAKAFIADKTDWRKMLKGVPEKIDLEQAAKNLLEQLLPTLSGLEYERVMGDFIQIHYPVLKYPEKVSSLNLDKTPEIESELVGIKAQYLIFESGVLNVRSHTGYQVSIEV